MTATGEISFDLVMGDDMAFVEGAYRFGGGQWQAFVFLAKRDSVREPQFRSTTWDSGVTGVVYEVPAALTLNRESVEQLLSAALGVETWVEVRGPDSMALR